MFKKIIKLAIDNYLLIIFALVFVLSWVLALHNIPLYHYSHGFDGPDHVKYIDYVAKHWRIPPTSYSTEAHQPPLYYFIAGLVTVIFRTIKYGQYLNIFILWAIIGATFIGLLKVFKEKKSAIVGAISLASLPMLNIFPSMYGNELLNTFFIISTLVACLFVISSKTKRQIVQSLGTFTFFFILGMWTKVSIITTFLPFIFSIYLLIRRNKTLFVFVLKSVFFVVFLITLFSLPILFRVSSTKSQSNIILVATRDTKRQPIEFFYRMDWIWNVDISKTQYYSLWGGAWNSFWTDGQNVVTPFVELNKKSLTLWILGFALFPLCVYGYFAKDENAVDLQKYRRVFVLIAITNLAFYIFFNYQTYHYSAVRLTYEMGIVLSYAYGIAAASRNKKVRLIIVLLLLFQFITMFTTYWINPTWHLAKPVDFSQFRN